MQYNIVYDIYVTPFAIILSSTSFGRYVTAMSNLLQFPKAKQSAVFEIRKIAVCFLWLSLPGDYRVADEALLAETT